jgi:NAD(P)H dehydrogenase (quinone)
VRDSRTWTGLAGTGGMALIDHRDAAEAGLRVLTDPTLSGGHHDLTGPVPMSWPEALELLSAGLGEPVTFRVAAEPQILQRLIGAGVPAGTAELLITREWSILAGENDYTTDTFQQITGHPPRPVAESSTSTARNSSDARASPSPSPDPTRSNPSQPAVFPTRSCFPCETYLGRL